MLKKLKIALGADHAGFSYKEMLKTYLGNQYELKDFGAYDNLSVDYPDFAHPVAMAVESKEFDLGILICGSGNGVCITANKHQGIRAALCWNAELATLAKRHNNANILCIPGRFVSEYVAQQMATVFLKTEFEGGRHQNRVNKISC